MRKVLGSLLTVCLILITTAVLVEVAYRIYLQRIVAAEVDKRVRAAARPNGQNFHVWAVAPWQFDREQGFRYTRGDWLSAHIRGSAFDFCSVSVGGNSFGNIDREPKYYFSADIRLMVVGSSFSQMRDHKGRLVNEVMMDDLSEQMRRPVSVLNFSRDSTGVLNYIETAAAVANELKPDAIIVLANTVSLNYRRHWRTVLPDEGGFRRLWFLLDPIEHLNDLNSPRAVPQTPFVYDRISDAWCKRLTAAKEQSDERALVEDPLVKAMVAERDRIADAVVAPRVTVNFWRYDASFVYNVLSTGDPFADGTIFAGQPVYSPITFDRYDDDPQFRAAIDRLKASKIPVILVHLPTLPEVQSTGGDFELVGNRKSLIADLERALGRQFINLYQYYPIELKSSPRQLFQSDTDFHPSELGVEMMAAALEKMLFEHRATAELFQRPPIRDKARFSGTVLLPQAVGD
jgi:hypothetical protein